MTLHEQRQEQCLALQKTLPAGSVVLYGAIEDKTTVVINSGPWYPNKDVDLYRLAAELQRR